MDLFCLVFDMRVWEIFLLKSVSETNKFSNLTSKSVMNNYFMQIWKESRVDEKIKFQIKVHV